MEDLLGDLEANEALLVNGQLDRDLARDYLLNDELGRNYMDSFLADGGVNKWASLYPSEDISRQYTDDDYLGTIFDNTWDSSYSHKQKKAEAKRRGSSPSTSQDTRSKLKRPVATDEQKAKEGFGTGDWLKVDKTDKEEDKPFPGSIDVWPKGVPKPKTMTKEELEKIAKDELAKLTEEEKKELNKMKTRPLTEEEKKKIGKGTRSKSGKGMTMDEIDAFLGIPIFSFLMKKRV